MTLLWSNSTRKWNLAPLYGHCVFRKRIKEIWQSLKKYGIATGWGVTQALKPLQVPKEHKRYSDRLKYSSFAIQSDQLCANKSAEYFFNSTVTFCAGDGKGRNDTCKGDSGGAFVREAKRGDDFRWVATGLGSSSGYMDTIPGCTHLLTG